MLDSLLEMLAVTSLGLTAWRWIVSARFPLHRRKAVTGTLPGLTILKPLKGCNAETKKCLRSWFAQRYPGSVQILCGVASAEDPVCGIVRELQAEFPQADARLIICDENYGANGKVSTLCQLEPHISNPLIIVSDCDVLVHDNFAAGVGRLLAVPGAGLVNCFYRMANPATMAMRWEAVAVNADFWSQVLQARSFSSIDFALGAVMSMPASRLRQIGGFAHLADYLADDYELGQSITRIGGRIEFTTDVVDCREESLGWEQVWKHQLRWARTIRACRPVPYFMSLLGNATLWPLLWGLLGTDPLAGRFCLLALAFRVISAAQQQWRLTQSGRHLFYWWMTPVKDLLDASIWVAAFWGNHVEWRQERYRILNGGKLLKIETQSVA